MSEVLIDDSSLNAIAHSIRRKNGLLRTYKPREMASAIRAFNDFIPDAHSFTINVQQSPHQTIRLRKYLDADQHEYTNTFTLSEPFYKADIIVEADAGYRAGQPNYVSPITIDRDMVISASPATEISRDEWTVVYYYGGYSGYVYGGYGGNDPAAYLYSDEERTTRIYGNSIRTYGLKIYPALVTNNPVNMEGCFINICNVKEIDVSSINVDDRISLFRDFANCVNAEKIDISHYNTGNIDSFQEIFNGCGHLTSVGDISNLDTSHLQNIEQMFEGCSRFVSLDISGWTTPQLRNMYRVFNGCAMLESIDISNLYTDELTNCDGVFGGCSALKYIIMDKEEIKFSNRIFQNPNNTVKYLVPSNMVNLYKEHANWQSRASQIDSIDNYTITRYDGKVFVTPNN